ncbi:DNA ligase D [Aquincola sp. S2]|uniref:DNA ligase (ATP) n=1 Tax=Pseudaquabacterium terrae TaxID=2732868 RepID=A0ABX2EAU3_9BURK|nr:DNA ligase D [Aquabacterium terrae]NRF65519.1 DNA ligase D [Aquabacterium terrae]
MSRPPAKVRADQLKPYRAKRDFERTPEPAGEVSGAGEGALCFVVQKHDATRLHYDFRLELDGVMLSWAVPRGPSFDPQDKRMAVQVEAHPISYNQFEGVIPAGQYGAGRVIIWDRGTWAPVGDPHQGLAEGKLVFTLHGQKLAGRWELVRIAKKDDERDVHGDRPAGKREKQVPWILFKKRDAHARPRAEYDVVSALPDSVVAKPLPPADAAPLPGRGGGLVDESGAARAPGELSGAKRAPLPDKLPPQLATAATALPARGDWLFEVKLDGYRVMTRIQSGQPALITRGGHDWTAKMPAIAAALRALKLHSAWLDGEVVVFGDDGLPSFNALQNAFDHRRSESIVYLLFDLPYLDGWDLRAVPLRERRALLAQLLQRANDDDAHDGKLRFSAAIDADPASLLQSARQLRLEGLMAKRADAPYVSRRSETWLKLKTRQRQEFVVGGFTDRGGARNAAEIGSLLLGVHDERGKLIPVGSVGTGWDGRSAAELKATLVTLERKGSPFAGDAAPPGGRWSRRNAGLERWVEPQLVAEVSFADWTPDEQIRHATFEGLRADKPAAQVRREVVRMVGDRKAAPAANDVDAPNGRQRTQVKVSHPERVIDPSSGLTKLDLVRYYESVADWILPHLKGRPCSLVRGPEGVTGELFFQKHAEQLRIPELKSLDPALWPGHQALLEVPSARALAGAAQMNVIEFHTWNAQVRDIAHPDRVIFDIDPGEGVGWPRVVEAALLVRGLLEELGLKAWLKTSGGKGLHVVVPLAPKHDWDTVKDFSQAVVQHLARVIPNRFVAKSGPANRIGKIFVDYLRNSHGATTATAYSARSRPGLGVSMPIAWEQLSEVKSGAHWTIADAREHLSFVSEDPWQGYWKSRQTLARALKRLGAGG